MIPANNDGRVVVEILLLDPLYELISLFAGTGDDILVLCSEFGSAVAA